MSIEVTTDRTDRSAESRQLPVRRATPIVIAPPAAAASGPEGMEIAPVLHAVRRRWQVSLLIGVFLGGGGAAAAWKSQQPKYTAASHLRVSASNPRLVFETAEGTNSFDIERSTQQQLILAPFVLGNALADEEVSQLPIVQMQDNPVSWLQESLTVSYPGNGEIMVVSLELGDAGACLKIIDAVITSYMRDVVETRKKERNERLQRLDTAYADVDSVVRQKRAQLLEYAKQLGVMSDAEAMSVAQQGMVKDYTFWHNALSEVEWELIQTENELAVLESMKDAVDQQESENPESADPPSDDDEPAADGAEIAVEQTASVSEEELQLLLSSDPNVTEWQAQIKQVNARITDTKERLSPQKAVEFNRANLARLSELETLLSEREHLIRTIAVQRKQEQLDQLRQQAAGRSGTAAFPDPMNSADDFHTQLQEKRFAAETLKASRDRLAEKLAVMEQDQSLMGGTSVEVELMQSELADQEGIRQTVAAERERTKIELKSDSRVELLSEARISGAPDKKKRLAITGAAGLCGLFAPLCLLVLHDFRKKHVNDVRSVTQSLETVHLGSIPRVPTRLLSRRENGKTRRYQLWQNRLLESVDSIASLLIRSSQLEQDRVIQVSSPTAREGKSTVATQLARSLARSGRRTILIDFDLRRPTLHVAFGFDLQPGVAEVLDQSAELESAIQQTPQANLDVLTAGCRQEKLFSGSSAGLLEELFRTLRQDYEFVIVDSCPVLPVVDARVVGQHVDGVILSLVKDFSKLPQAARTCEIMKSYGIRLIGTVVTGCELDDQYYGEGQEYVR